MTDLLPEQDYTDKLLPLDAWPSLHAYYVIWKNSAKEGQPELRAGLLFDDSRYKISGTIDAETAKNNAVEDLAVYTRICSQLKPADEDAPQADMVLSVSLLNDPKIKLVPGQRSIIIDFAKDACVYLQSKVDNVDDNTTPIPPAETA